jgi:hypothetical protein
MKITRATRRRSTQPWKLQCTRRSDSLQTGEKSKPMEQGNEKQSRRMVRPQTLELIHMSPSGSGKTPSYTWHLCCDTNPSGANKSCSTPLHRMSTPSPQSASSWRKPCDPTMCPPALKLLGTPGSRLRGRELLPCIGSSPWLRLAFLATMRPALNPAGHRVPQAEPTWLSTPRRPRKA